MSDSVANTRVNGRLADRADTPVLSLRNVSKEFAGNPVLKDVALELGPGEVRGLVGQNGSGKSTLLKILAGYHNPQPGAAATVDGQPFQLGSSQAAFAAGLRFVHQDLGLAPDLNALDNLALGRGYLRGRTGAIAWRAERKRAKETLATLGFEVDLTTPISKLSAAERTAVAIARATEDCREGKVRLLILDEPTAALPSAEASQLFDVIRRINEQGVSIIFVSHRFSEIFELCNTVTVLRDGSVVDTVAADGMDLPKLIELTLGRTVAVFERELSTRPTKGVAGAPILQARGLAGQVVSNVDLDVFPNEVVGVAGVTGSGREEIAELLFASPARQGRVTLEERPLPPARPDLCYGRGVALVPADRHAKAVLTGMTLRENLTISRLETNYKAAGLSKRTEQLDADEWLGRLDVRPRDTEADVDTLSGGNQQKIVMARALRLKPRVLILDEPTQGVDVGAKAAIHEILSTAASEGAGVVVVSSDSEELLAISDRILVLVQGRAIGVFRASDLSVEALDELVIREDLLAHSK